MEEAEEETEEEAVAVEEKVAEEVEEVAPTLESGPGKMCLLLLALYKPRS